MPLPSEWPCPLPAPQCLSSGGLRRWKAVAVVGLLEKRVGEETFQRQLGQLVQAAVAQLYDTEIGDTVCEGDVRSKVQGSSNGMLRGI